MTFTQKIILLKTIIKIKSKETGYIKSINTEKIGWALVEMGCGKKSNKRYP